MLRRALVLAVYLVSGGIRDCHLAYTQPHPDCCSYLDAEESTLMSEEKRLIKHLLKRYRTVGIHGRPIYNVSQTLSVEFGLGLIQMDLDEKYKILQLSMWSRLRWFDEYLKWDPQDYAGVTTIRLQSRYIWIPDIRLYNTADPESRARDVLAIVSYDGKVLWVPHQIFKSSCSVDVTNFPFDHQHCHMWFGSWTHTASEIDLVMAFPSGIDLTTFQSDYKESSAWSIYNTTAEKRILPAANESHRYSVITFQLDMRRKVVFSSYILTMPCVFLACLTLAVFWLPPDRPDRTALAMSVFSSFLVLLLILVEAAPPTASSVPVLGVYYCFNMVIIMMAVFLSTLVVNVFRRGEGTRPVPRWLFVICVQWCSRLMGFVELSEEAQEQVNDVTDNGYILCGESRRGPLPTDHTEDVQREMQELRKSLVQIRQNMASVGTHRHQQAQRAREWRRVALVMDRLFFILYIILIVVSLASFFPRVQLDQ